MISSDCFASGHMYNSTFKENYSISDISRLDIDIHMQEIKLKEQSHERGFDNEFRFKIKGMVMRKQLGLITGIDKTNIFLWRFFLETFQSVLGLSWEGTFCSSINNWGQFGSSVHSHRKWKCVSLPAVALPHVAAYKHSEHGNEKDKGVMVCVSHGYPLPTDWTWFKEEDGGQKVGVLSQNYDSWHVFFFFNHLQILWGTISW